MYFYYACIYKYYYIYYISNDVQITECHQCARLTGLDSWDGLLLFGSTSFYVVEGITITKDSNVVDIESATDGLVLNNNCYSIYIEVVQYTCTLWH